MAKKNIVEIVDISDNLKALYTIKINGEGFGMLYLRPAAIEGMIKEMRERGFAGEYEEHFAEMCAREFAFREIQNGYFHHYNCTGYLIHGGEYPESLFYVALDAAYKFVLPIFKEKLTAVNA